MGPERAFLARHPLGREPFGDIGLKRHSAFCPLRRRQNQHPGRAATWKGFDLPERDPKGRHRNLAVHGEHDSAAALLGHLSDEGERQVLLFWLDQSQLARSAEPVDDLLLNVQCSRTSRIGQFDGGEQTHN